MNSSRYSRADASRLQRTLVLVKQLQWWLFAAVGLAGGIAYYTQPLEDPSVLRDLVAQAEAKVTSLTDQRQRVINRIEWLKTEPEYLEAAIRDHLNQQKEGETIIRLK